MNNPNTGERKNIRYIIPCHEMRYTAVVGIMDDLSLGHGNPNGFGAISDWTIHTNRTKINSRLFFYSSRCKSWQKSPGFPQKNSQMRGWNGELNPSIASTSMWFQFCYARYFYLVSILKKTCSTPKASSKVLCCYVMFCFLCPPNKYWYQSGGDLKEKIFPQTLRFYPRTTHHPPRCMPPWRTLKPKQFNLWEDGWGVQKNQQRRTLYGLKSITFWS